MHFPVFLSVLLAVFVSRCCALDTIEVKGTEFVYKTSGDRFEIIGVA
jgi:hypothetical protein